MKKMLFTANDVKRLRMIEEKSQYANTKWLISKIKALVWEMSRIQKDLDAALAYNAEIEAHYSKAKGQVESKLREESAKYANQIKSLQNELDRLKPSRSIR